MKMTKVFLAVVTMGIFFSACDDGFWGSSPSPSAQYSSDLSGDGRGTPGRHNDTESAGGEGSSTVPYPEIIKRIYVPTYRPWAGTRCRAWKITWPEYGGSVSAAQIASVFSTPSGALNSFKYLNDTDPKNTYNTRFSLYHGNKVECTFGMWDDLTYALGGPMETVYFAKTDQPLDIVQHWVEDRPSQFESYWPGGSDMELDYDQGDIILFKQVDSNRYGGIRIVSLSPRIIEVYFAEPND